jgi:UDP-N-acetylglucosamine:LPS N-acetylglucosamine transferase
MFGLAVRLAIGITCSALLLTEALGEGLPTYILMAAMLLAAVWKWAYRLVRLITGTNTVATRKSEDEFAETGISDHIEERIRQATQLAQAASQQSQQIDDEPIRTKVNQQPNVPPMAFGKRR